MYRLSLPLSETKLQKKCQEIRISTQNLFASSPYPLHIFTMQKWLTAEFTNSDNKHQRNFNLMETVIVQKQKGLIDDQKKTKNRKQQIKHL